MATTKHLATGDAFPQLPDDDNQLILLSMRFCPFAQRVHLVLDAKRIDHHVVNIALQQKPDWFGQLSRRGQVPALGVAQNPGSPYMLESLLIADYLDERFRHVRPLHPVDPSERLQDQLWLERFGAIVPTYYAVLFAGKHDPVATEQLATVLDAFEVELGRRGGRYFCGAEQPGMLDYMIWPWVERLDSLRWAKEVRLDFSAERFPRLVEYAVDMKQDEAVQKSYLPGEVHYRFTIDHFAGQPDYELLSTLEDV